VPGLSVDPETHQGLLGDTELRPLAPQGLAAAEAAVDELWAAPRVLA
jgi:hypothetical protein